MPRPPLFPSQIGQTVSYILNVSGFTTSGPGHVTKADFAEKVHELAEADNGGALIVEARHKAAVETAIEVGLLRRARFRWTLRPLLRHVGQDLGRVTTAQGRRAGWGEGVP